MNLFRSDRGVYERVLSHDDARWSDRRFTAWRELGIERATRFNPLQLIQTRDRLPANLDSDWFPGGRDSATLDDATFEIDAIEQRSGEFAPLAWSQWELLKRAPTENALFWCRSYMVQAGWEYFERAEYTEALRYFLNTARLKVGLDFHIRANWAYCLQELGDFNNAAVSYLSAAQDAEERGELESAADLFERTALNWEMVEGTRPSLGTSYPRMAHYDSTSCFRRAKMLYGTLGEYDGASRAAVLEMDMRRRWGKANTQWRLFASRAVWLYGESPARILRLVLLAIVTFAILFMFFGFKSGNTIIIYAIGGDGRFDAYRLCADFLNAIYFSAITLATVGYGDCTPLPGASRAFAALEGLIGILLMALLVATVQRRYGGR